MNKRELIEKTAAETGMTKADITKALGGLLDTVQAAVAAGEEVALPGFGTFKRTLRAGGERRNPATGETIVVADKRVPVFKAGAGFKGLVNAG